MSKYPKSDQQRRAYQKSVNSSYTKTGHFSIFFTLFNNYPQQKREKQTVFFFQITKNQTRVHSKKTYIKILLYSIFLTKKKFSIY